MPKINQEEYEVLKRLIAPLRKFKQYIARDEDGMLYAYKVKPRRYTNQKWVDGLQKVGVQQDLFQFIQWEDEEPYNIAELIEEYEYSALERHVNSFKELSEAIRTNESEETEVKKDKQWLEKELRNLEKLVKEALEASLIAKNEHYTEKNSNELQLLRRVFSLINQLDEPDEREQLETAYKDILNRGEFWFDDKRYMVVPKQELPVIPQWVADWIEHNKKTGSIHQATNLNSIHTEIHFKEIYANQSIELQELIARAWLDGYEVEEVRYNGN